eukprot:TRINITY_DN1747_c2_g2_i1.p1 TRINITY_DN1747_c2_g2~~TRINITY_DN1747_c2_g2_i1.p1  ORF type:complete len:1069 (+),score=159.47 TRINITY_DN1747_c2_g2_i1:99-3209(+)
MVKSVGTGGATITLPEDPVEAFAKYKHIRELIRQTFESFLRSLNSQSLRWLEQQFEKSGGELNSGAFLPIFARVCPRLESQILTNYEERKLAVHLAVLRLFEGMDVDRSGTADWMEFVEFISAVAEELRLKAEDMSGQIFEFEMSTGAVPNYRPSVTKCHFDRIFYWPEHPSDTALVLEGGQPSFFIHRSQTLQRKRRINGHQSEVLAACYMPAPYDLVVTAGNDKMICFWDSSYALSKRWTLKKKVIGELCWCPCVNALYAADHFSGEFFGWRVYDALDIKGSEKPLKPDDQLAFDVGPSKAIQAMLWLKPLQTLATASLDTTVQLFDMVLGVRSHVLSGHSKGLTCLGFCEHNQMLLSAGFDNYINIWDPAAGSLSHKLMGHDCSITGLVKMPDTDYEFMSVDFDGVCRLWDVRRLTCTQSFHATDRRAEEAGEVEALETRALCAISRDRVVVSGRRMVVFDRDAADPRLTADWPINAITFNHRTLEIFTPIKNDLYVWDALTGERLQIHDNVIEGNITAINFAEGERKLFVGSDDGSIVCVNAACGDFLKNLTPHGDNNEVTQIECVPGKVYSLSSPEKVILVHDDGDSDKSVLLKTIDVSGAGVLLRMAHNGGEMIVGASEEGDVYWYNADFAKQVRDTSKCEVKHNQATFCCKYFEEAPLIVSADAEGCCLFWSIPPLRTHDFFNKITLSLGAEEGTTVGITSLTLSWPDEDRLFIGTERGAIACVNISRIVDSAKTLKKEILLRKENGEAAEVISGRIFDSMPKPNDSPEYVFALPNEWFIEKAHKGTVDSIVACKQHPCVLITLGSDACVRIWNHETGEALGDLEQGLPEGLAYERETTWTFPLDVHEQIQKDLNVLAEALAVTDEEEDEAPKQKEKEKESQEEKDKELEKVATASQGSQGRRADIRDLRRSSSTSALGKAGGGRQGLFGGHSQSRSSHQMPSSMQFLSDPDYSKVLPRYLEPKRGAIPMDEWYAGPAAPNFGYDKGQSLPRLQSGLTRPSSLQTKKVLEAARQLAISLGDVRSSKDLI